MEGTRDPPRFIGKILDIGCGDGALMPHLVDPTAATADKKKGKVGKGLKKKRKQAEEQKGSEAPEEVAITGALGKGPLWNLRIFESRFGLGVRFD